MTGKILKFGKNGSIVEGANLIFKGFGQVMLQNNVVTGVLFLLGIAVNSWMMALGAIVGGVCGTLGAICLKYPKKEVSDGLFGFNGVLVGIALMFFFKPSAIMFAAIAIGAVASSIVMRIMLERKFPAYTFPFVLCTWVLLFMLKNTAWGVAQTHESAATGLNALSALTLGISQVMFQANILTGVLFFAGLLLSSRLAAFYALLGSALGLVGGMVMGVEATALTFGLWGYNGVLCGIAFAEKKNAAIAYAVLSIVFSVLFSYGLDSIGAVALTAPFVFAAWSTLAIRKGIGTR